MNDQYGGQRPGDEQPGPFPGAYPAGQPPPSQYGGSFGRPNPYADLPGPVPPPSQVTIAVVISLVLGVLCVLGALFSLTSAAEPMSKLLTGTKDGRTLMAMAFLFCAFIYVLPALYLRKRRPWARIMLIVVAGFGTCLGVVGLPTTSLSVAVHITLLVLMLQRPTRLWFHR